MGIDARLYAVTAKGSKKLTEADVWKMAFEIGLAFGHEKFMRHEQDEVYTGWTHKKHHNISIEDSIEEDSNEVPTRKFPKQQILEVHLWTRYYGVGYERGDLPLIIAVAEWLECRLPGCEVRYGGDSSGVVSEPFPHKERMKLLKHFASEHGRDYFGYFSEKMGNTIMPKCDFCLVPMTQYGWPGGRRAGGKYVCHGCGKKLTSDDGVTFEPYEELQYKSRPVNEILHAIQSYLGKWHGEGCVPEGDNLRLHMKISEIIEAHKHEFKKDLEF